MVFELDGKIALITGAGAEKGIGFATAKVLTSLGAKVYLTGQSSRVLERVEELKKESFVAAGDLADLTSENQVKDLIEKVINRYSTLDILINNAGMTSVNSPMDKMGEIGSILEITFENFKNTLDRNLSSAFLVTKQALPHLRNSKNGRVVMVASTTGTVMAMKNEVAYAAAKAGLVGLTKAIALDEAKSAITVNAVSPGWIATESQTSDEIKQGKATPIGRSAVSEEVAATIAWLCTNEASYITGQNIVVDGGNSISEERVNL